MEGPDQTGQQPIVAPPVPIPPKSNLMMITVAAVAIIAIVIIAVVLVVVPGSNGSSTNGGTATWKVGDYFEYSVTSPGSSTQMVERLTVKQINNSDNKVLLNMTMSGIGIPSLSEQWYSNTFMSDLNNNDHYVSFVKTDIGNEKLSTVWGDKTCDHVRITYTLYGTSYTANYWYYNGFIIKGVTQAGTSTTQTMILTSTNVSGITG